LASNFNNDSETVTMELPKDHAPAPPAPQDQPGTDAPAPAAPQPTPVVESAAWVKFRSCRWHQPKEDGNAEFCTHREVKPYAGTTGFDAEAWCPDCQYYKLRRSPKKREPRDDYSY
jgi:hypothetical protein